MDFDQIQIYANFCIRVDKATVVRRTYQHDLAVCLCDEENQLMSGLYCQECSQQLEGSSESPLFSTCETVLGAWCLVLTNSCKTDIVVLERSGGGIGKLLEGQNTQQLRRC